MEKLYEHCVLGRDRAQKKEGWLAEMELLHLNDPGMTPEEWFAEMQKRGILEEVEE